MADLKGKRMAQMKRPPLEATPLSPTPQMQTVPIENVVSSLAVVREQQKQRLAADVANIKKQLIEMNYYLKCIAENHAPKDEEVIKLLQKE